MCKILHTGGRLGSRRSQPLQPFLSGLCWLLPSPTPPPSPGPPVLSVPCGTGQRLASRVPVRRGWLPVAQGAAGTPWRTPRQSARRGVCGQTPAPAGRMARGHGTGWVSQPVEKAV